MFVVLLNCLAVGGTPTPAHTAPALNQSCWLADRHEASAGGRGPAPDREVGKLFMVTQIGEVFYCFSASGLVQFRQFPRGEAGQALSALGGPCFSRRDFETWNGRIPLRQSLPPTRNSPESPSRRQAAGDGSPGFGQFAASFFSQTAGGPDRRLRLSG